MSNCVFAGTFDPFTVGHEDIVERCKSIFGKVFVVVGENPEKKPFFSLSLRVAAIKAQYSGDEKVEVLSFAETKNYAEFLKVRGVTAYVRGIRNAADFDFERRAETKNKSLYSGVETVYLSADNEISSTAVRKLIAVQEDYSKFVPQKAYKVYAAEKSE